jgi:DNA-binding response OmpR family regulator
MSIYLAVENDWKGQFVSVILHPPQAVFAVPASNYRILIVDDLADNLFLLQTILEAEGYAVEVADNGRLAVAKVAAAPPDLILLDVMMPDLNGYEVTRQIRQNQAVPYMPILLVTAYEQAQAVEGFDVGANDFIRKPIEFAQLLARVKAFLQVSQSGV